MSKEFVGFINDQLFPRFHFQSKNMFGETCLFSAGKIVAIINKDNQIFVKANAQTQSHFQQIGSTQYEYFSKGKWQKMHYWSIPDEAVEAPEMLQMWFELAMQALHR
ncbi:TfoX/Sxy family protein [Actinobacillus vicugnae]|uniref:TfoX/Sxy family protein n=1 Tax=Actinobacillus vicugnae TaxID=2573093 RepID=UPI0012424930|nr:TfoX/Sxy family protein [Actinobacillus vicugnae]